MPVPITENEKMKISKPIPVKEILIGSNIYRCPICGGSIHHVQPENRKGIKVICSACALQGTLHGNAIRFTSRKGVKNIAKKPRQEEVIPAIDTRKMTDQEFFEYIAKEKGLNKRILPKGEHKKVLTKHKKPSGYGRVAYHKPGKVKLWS